MRCIARSKPIPLGGPRSALLDHALGRGYCAESCGADRSGALLKTLGTESVVNSACYTSDVGDREPTTVTYSMRHLKPRWALSIDPHLSIDGTQIGPFTRTPRSVGLVLGAEVLVIVSPTEQPPAWKLERRTTEAVFSPYICRETAAAPGGTIEIRYRPNRLYGYLFRGSLTIASTPPPPPPQSGMHN